MIVSGNNFLLLTYPGPFKPNLFDNFGNSKTIHTIFKLKLEQLSCKKALKFALLGKCFFDPLTEVKIWC